MLSITMRENGFSIFGHAELAPLGQDILCSAVSFLSQMVVKELKRYVEIRDYAEPGMMDVVLVTKSPESKILLELLENGVTELTRIYPNNVQIKKIY